MTDESMLVRIRGEAARRIRAEKEATGAPYTAIVERRLLEVFEALDKKRGQSVSFGYPEYYRSQPEDQGE